MATAKNISTENKINIVTNTENNVTVTQPSIQTVEILTGPQGPAGIQGSIGPSGSFDTGSLGNTNITGTLTVTGSVTVSGSNTFTNVGLALFNGAFAQGDNSSQVTNQSFIDAMGAGAFAQGQVTRATGEASHAEGRETEASGIFSHAQGEMSKAVGRASFVAGDLNTASAAYSFVIGTENKETHGKFGFVAGYRNTSTEDAKYSSVLGYQSHVLGFAAVAIGRKTSASFYGFASGDATRALFAAHAEGRSTRANSRYTHTEGVSTMGGGHFVTLFTSSTTEPTSNWGDEDEDSDINDGDVWYNTSNSLLYAYSGSPSGVFVSQNDTPVETIAFNTSSGVYSFFTASAAFGNGDTFPPSSGSDILAARHQYNQGKHSHAEGVLTITYGRNSHAEGKSTVAAGFASHAEGLSTRTGAYNSYYAQLEQHLGGSGSYAHAEGKQTQAVGIASHAEGLSSRALGDYSHAEGLLTIAEGAYQHTMGRYNVSNTHSLVIIGNGTTSNNKRNLVEFDLNGVVINQPITASSDISASGRLYGGLISSSQPHIVFYNEASGELTYAPSASSGGSGGGFTPGPTAPLVVKSITASADISSSGDIISSKSKVGSSTSLSTAGGSTPNLFVQKNSSGYAGNLPIDTTAIIENNSTTYMGAISPDSSVAGFYMGSPSDIFGAVINWGYNQGYLLLSAAKVGHGIQFKVGNKINNSMNLSPTNSATGDNHATLTLTGSLIVSGSSSHISASGTIFANDLILDYDSLPTSDPSTKGQVYRNGSNQLFISAG